MVDQHRLCPLIGQKKDSVGAVEGGFFMPALVRQPKLDRSPNLIAGRDHQFFVQIQSDLIGSSLQPDPPIHRCTVVRLPSIGIRPDLQLRYHSVSQTCRSDVPSIIGIKESGPYGCTQKNNTAPCCHRKPAQHQRGDSHNQCSRSENKESSSTKTVCAQCGACTEADGKPHEFAHDDPPLSF